MKKIGFFNLMVRNMLWTHKMFQYKVEIISDNPNPDNLINDIIYIVVDKNHAKWAYLKCPSGCNEIIMLSLNIKEFPSWCVKQDKFGRASITPSIRKLDGCKSHFLIKKGKLIWARELD
jgi:hypothetical protein